MSEPRPAHVPPSAPSGAPRLAYESDGTAVYWILYYVLLVTRRRRPFFESPAMKARCEALLAEAATATGCTLVAREVSPSSAILQITCPPTLSPHNAVIRIRRTVSAALAEEFDEIRRAKVAFGRPYMITTVPVPETELAGVEASMSRQ